MPNPIRHGATRRALPLPTALAVAVLVAAGGCTGSPPPTGADCGAADACTQATTEDGAALFTVCPSQVNCECARLIYPDGAVVDPTYC